jgi:hypothetical protein
MARPTIADPELASKLMIATNNPRIDTPTKSSGKKYRITPKIPRIIRIVSSLDGRSPSQGAANMSTMIGVKFKINENVIAGRYKRAKN